MSDDAHDDQPSGTNLPPEPKPRIAPKLGLKGQIRFITELRLRALMMDGEPAGEAWLRLTPIDLERLDDLAAGLDILAMQEDDRRIKSKYRGQQ